MDHLPFLRAVVRETLRLQMLVPFVPNKAATSVQVHGYTIPKGSTVIMNLWGVHHDAEVWPEPDRFIPDRFLGDKEFHFLGADLEFIPFSAGRRICLVFPLASRMMHVILATLLHRFEWALPRLAEQNGVDMSEKIGVTLSMANPLKAIPKPI
ncbi:geraniol 8-hydroxylase-like [Brachypodium distachyon]|nr:geraniol 8-hydroxylase-like [Brachypodium distachyon]|eukprot:XP_024317210.1 geraniol 8-hydroxylase-like [Brachypodium distachyon]